ncbi:MAG: hypothetical protein Q8S15_04810 [Erysipelotrichaceae bacterium]|nr:hypothetical protein [Erysipelotrichaceae bacterium]
MKFLNFMFRVFRGMFVFGLIIIITLLSICNYNVRNMNKNRW